MASQNGVDVDTFRQYDVLALSGGNVDGIMKKLYEDRAEKYDEDLNESNFHGHINCAEYLDKHAKRYNLGKDCRILDIGAGTGNVGAELASKFGYTNLDAVEPSEAMREVARGKGVYKELFDTMLQKENDLPMANDTYDAAVMSGVVVPGHVSPEAVLDIIRVVKPGGLIVNAMREEHTRVYENWQVRPPWARWQLEGRWELVEWAIPTRSHVMGKDGAVIVFRKTP